tara:strand:- start:255 stop:605 length:351 start_codon:yes stop_codon:yes gene_type:complete
MSNQKKQNYLVPVLIFENWFRLLDIEAKRVKLLIKHYADEKHGLMAAQSFETLCAYLSICNEMKLLVEMFLEDIPSDNSKKIKLTDLEYLTYKTIAKSVEAYRLKLRDFNIVTELN